VNNNFQGATGKSKLVMIIFHKQLSLSSQLVDKFEA